MSEQIALVYLIAGFGSLLASLILTPLVRAISRRLGFVDKPDGRRKTHTTAVALGGGAAVFLATVVALAVALGYGFANDPELLGARNWMLPIGLAIAAVAIVALGLVDDLTAMRGRTKLLGQIVIIAGLVALGSHIEKLSFAGYTWELGWFAIPATFIWLIITTNAINLIDGIDGLAGSVGFILCLTMAAINAWQGHTLEAAIMIALAGAQLGFLRYNLAPASIYLGDAGSMLVGLMVGAVAVQTSAKSSAAMALSVPLAVWAIPMLDTAAAFLRRKLTGRSLFAPDRGHLHHSLLVRGWSVQQASLFVALVCATTCLSAIMSLTMNDDRIAIVTVVAVMAFLIYTKTFGHIEFTLVSNQVRNLAASLTSTQKYNVKRESSIQLQGSREWRKLWQAIIERAEDYQLTRINLTINVHRLHECFYASWEAPHDRKIASERVWRLTHPLVMDGDAIGKIELTGQAAQDNCSTVGQILPALEFLEPIEDDIRSLLEKVAAEACELKIGLSSVATKPLIDVELPDQSSLTGPALQK